ncbi:MAG TPA: TldD/PmbA family protein [bacterium]|nr:TldD/PmbA family protein [bacterium]
MNDISGPDIQYVDIRITRHSWESHAADTSGSRSTDSGSGSGFGVRVLRRGAWGYAASMVIDADEAIRAGRLAADLALASSRLMSRPVRLAPVQPLDTTWIAPVVEDPFALATEFKLDFLVNSLGIASQVRGIGGVSGSMEFRRLEQWFASSEGSRIRQEIIIPAFAMTIRAGDGRGAQTRSWPSSHGGYTCTGGFEKIRSMVRREAVEQAAGEAVMLTTAPPCPEGRFPVVLAPDQMSLQIHESIGHPLELDRVFGVEANFSGTSFAQPEGMGQLQFGSPLINVVTDPTESGVLGAYGYDDDGVPARPVTLIRDGILRGYLSGRETAGRLGVPSSANNRAADWRHYPINRMSNTRLEPGNATWDDLLAGAEGGLIMATNRSWSIDDRRESFRFECEAAWEIKSGKRGKIYRNPAYTGRTLDFWRSCDAVGHAALYENWGTPNCGKGEPSQSIHTSQGSAPARFQNVSVSASGQRKGHPHGG